MRTKYGKIERLPMTADLIPNAIYPVPIMGSRRTLTEGRNNTNTAINTVVAVAKMEIHISNSELDDSTKESSYISYDGDG